MITREDVVNLFKSELELIKDKELREKVMKAWVLGCERGGWESIGDLEQMPFTLLNETYGVNFIEHTKAVTWGAYHLADAQQSNYTGLPYTIDFDRLVAGGLLHDVGKLLEIETDNAGEYWKGHAGRCARHPISGAILASEVGLSQEIVNIIACHAKEGEWKRQVIETIFIHQADFATFNPLVMKQKGMLIEKEG